MATCYRHPNRETGVACSACGRPICPDCMTPTPVGMRCPECARDRTKVRTAANVRNRTPRGTGLTRYSITEIILAINVVVFLAEVATGTGILGASGRFGTVFYDGMLVGPFIHGGAPGGLDQPYRLVTAAFIHDGLIHIAFNMWFLYVVGMALERGIGRRPYLAIYAASIFAGSFGALLFQPDSPSVGASGALFGLFGALIVIANRRGISIWQSGLGATLVLNIVISLSIPDISIGAHAGGLVGGLILGWVYTEFGERRGRQPVFYAGCLVLAAAAIAGAYAVALGHGLTPNGLKLF
ncbi:MAG: rhomboid family intramembrane serine protease [Solirubrobacteraceae bacterium]